MPLFEVAILEKPTRKQIEEEGAEEVLVFGPKAVIARDPQSAAIRATMAEPEKMKEIKQDRMEVLVRPFA